jgi:hypothetical protein
MKHFAIAAPAALIAVLAPFSATAAATDEKWEITTRMEMTGLPMRMPATTVVVCVPPGGMDEERIVERDGCTLGKVTRSGQTTRFSVQCAQPQPMTGEGEITRSGASAYSGQFRASGKFGGKDVTMSASFNGKRAGDCVAAPAGVTSTSGTTGATEGEGDGMPQDAAAVAEMLQQHAAEGFDLNDPAVLDALRRLQPKDTGASP